MSDTCLVGLSLASVMITCLIRSLCCSAACCRACRYPTAQMFEIEAFENTLVLGGVFLNGVVSTNLIGPLCQISERDTRWPGASSARAKLVAPSDRIVAESEATTP